MVEKVKERHDGPGSPPDPATIASAVAHFRGTGEPDGWRGLKRVCFGAGSVDEKDWCVLSDDKLRDRLLALAQGQEEARKRIRCYQSLLSSYWRFPLATADARAQAGWLALRDWLDRRMQPISRNMSRIPGPGWFQTIVQHRNLLRDDPCGRYGPKLLAGDGSEFQQAVAGLGIPSDSWVQDQAVLAQMRAGCKLGHERFQEILPGLLAVAMGQAGISPSKSLQAKCIATLVSRYAKVPGTPQHLALQDAAVGVIGNPWLRRASWDATVVDERGQPDNAAREMVFVWLKCRLIKDFFELLSDDGMGDRRRLEYWLRFEPFIGDMWFALGKQARERRGEAFDDFRSRAKGRLLDLDGTTADNNAFVMRVGEYLAVEFGSKGHAFYLFRWDSLPKKVMERLTSGGEHVAVDISSLGGEHVAVDISSFKSGDNEGRLIHMDSAGRGLSWEQKFDHAMCPLIGGWPQQSPQGLGGRSTRPRPEHRAGTQTSRFEPSSADESDDLNRFVRKWRFRVEDNRPKGGALWIIADDRYATAVATLKKWGFQYKPGKGWWKE